MPADGSSPADRRTQQGLVFDPESRWLSIGRFVQEIDPGGGNRAVLNAYVELTARCRHDRIANVIHVRDSDVRALADALDLKADDLASEIESVLALSRAEALKTIGRMRESRLIGGLAKAATGAVVAGSLVAGGVAATRAVTDEPSAASSRPIVPPTPREPPPTSVADALRSAPTAAPVVDGPLTETDDGVGLIPPVTLDAEGEVGLIPPANVEADAGAEASATDPGVGLIPPANEDRPGS
ncbi:MAG: hypothetical protein KDB04_10280 [Acidimicrobiales bacterium]|nr:hypothetical protein [Acidimicrobiales bacterium]HRW36068.1 hypothetical protein [Aquihabitans sp.]